MPMTQGEKRWMTRCPGCDAELPELDALRTRVAKLEAATRSFISTVLTVKRENQPEWMEYLAERISEVCQVIGDEDHFTYYPSHEAILPTKK